MLFDPQTVRDVASFSDPKRPADGIEAVMVNGVMSYGSDKKNYRAGRGVSCAVGWTKELSMSIKRYGVEGGTGTGGQHLPFARAVEAGGWLYVSGQTPMKKMAKS